MISVNSPRTGAASKWVRRAAHSVVADARANDHLASLLFALAQAACPVAPYAGDLAAADHYVKLVLDLAVKHALETWRASGQCFEGVLRIKRGDSGADARLLRSALGEVPPAAFHVHSAILLAELVEGLGGAGQIVEGLAVVDDALARAERTEGRWCIAELLRKKGELLFLRGAPAAAADAEECFRHARLGTAPRRSLVGAGKRDQPRTARETKRIRSLSSNARLPPYSIVKFFDHAR